MHRLWFVALTLASSGCPKTPPPECKTIETACAPGYEPTFENVWTHTIEQSCGSTKSSCHSSSGESGMSLATIDDAYASLVEGGRVKPFDPSCSELIVRTSSPGTDYAMPPSGGSAAISDPTRCALILWVNMGAMRSP
jgi:hypothetical protein